jgi:hypothetical protein
MTTNESKPESPQEFCERVEKLWRSGSDATLFAAIAHIRKLVEWKEKAVEIIKGCEWTGINYDESCCPECFKPAYRNPEGKHEDGCKLNALLENQP